jgi:hypothetical protein
MTYLVTRVLTLPCGFGARVAEAWALAEGSCTFPFGYSRRGKI